jgi:anti-sigma regulatory factor (Ser/Thr protein kinase)
LRGIDIRRQLSHEPASVPEARASLAPLERVLDSRTFENLRLLVTELVGNSVRHAAPQAGEDIELSVRASDERIRVEVANSGPGFTPLPRAAAADVASGWGLHILETLSDGWGTEEDEKMRVWFELVAASALAAGGPRT